jgi:nicotinic acid mononucleotide adenylyltransferase
VALSLLAVTVTSSNCKALSDAASSAALATRGTMVKVAMPASEPSSEAEMMRDTVFDTVDTLNPL